VGLACLTLKTVCEGQKPRAFGLASAAGLKCRPLHAGEVAPHVVMALRACAQLRHHDEVGDEAASGGLSSGVRAFLFGQSGVVCVGVCDYLFGQSGVVCAGVCEFVPVCLRTVLRVPRVSACPCLACHVSACTSVHGTVSRAVCVSAISMQVCSVCMCLRAAMC